MDNDESSKDDNEIRYFWRKNDYKYETLMRNIKELSLENGFMSEEFDYLQLNFQDRIKEQRRFGNKEGNEDLNFKVYDDMSSFLLDLNAAEQSSYPRLCTPFFESNEISAASKIKNYSHKNVDLHGFTQNGCRQVVRRILLSLDRKKKNTIKFNVGKGKHSADNNPVLPAIVCEVCQSLGFRQPTISSKNQGYLQITIDPITPDESNDMK